MVDLPDSREVMCFGGRSLAQRESNGADSPYAGADSRGYPTIQLQHARECMP